MPSYSGSTACITVVNDRSHMTLLPNKLGVMVMGVIKPGGQRKSDPASGDAQGYVREVPLCIRYLI